MLHHQQTCFTRRKKTMCKGYSQQEGIDCSESFALVVRHKSVRAVILRAAVLDLVMIQLDVKTALLRGCER